MAKVSPIPPGAHTVTASLVCKNASEAIEFYKKAFGAEEVDRNIGPGGKIMHATIRIGDSAVFLTDEMPEWGSRGPLLIGGSPVSLHIYTEDADALFARAEKAGAKVAMPLADQFWGDRFGKLDDPFGHHWSIGMRIKEMTPAQIDQAMKEWMASMGQQKKG